MLVGYGIEEPFDIFLARHDTWQTQDLERWVVGMHTHIHIALVAYGHDSFEEVFHISPQLVAADTFI